MRKTIGKVTNYGTCLASTITDDLGWSSALINPVWIDHWIDHPL